MYRRWRRRRLHTATAMSQALADWFAELRAPLEIPDFEPDIDDKDQKKDTALRYSSRCACSVMAQSRCNGAAKLDINQGRCAALVRVPQRTPCREQDAVDSGLIQKVHYRQSKSGVVPVDGDLVSCREACWFLFVVPRTVDIAINDACDGTVSGDTVSVSRLCHCCSRRNGDKKRHHAVQPKC